MTLSKERRTTDDTTRRYVTGVMFGDEDAHVLVRALEGHVGALGNDDKEKDRVGKHLNRIRNQGEPYFHTDLHDLDVTLRDLQALWAPQTNVEWWRERGAPGSDAAVAGLAGDRTRQWWNAQRAHELVDGIVREIIWRYSA